MNCTDRRVVPCNSRCELPEQRLLRVHICYTEFACMHEARNRTGQ